MKKALWIIAAALMVFAACNKDNKPNKPHGGGIEEGDELILIDGQFADWAALENVVTFKNNPEFVGGTVTEDHQRVDALKTMKLAADKYNVYVYLEVDESVMYEGGVPKWDKSLTVDGYPGPLQLFFDTDNNPNTGGHEWEYAEMGYEFFFENGAVFSTDASAVGEMEGGMLAKFTGANDAEMWAEDPATYEVITGEGLFAGWGKKDGDIIKYELSFTRSFLNISGKKIKVGAVVMQDPDWMLEGVLPQSTAEGEWKGGLGEVELP